MANMEVHSNSYRHFGCCRPMMMNGPYSCGIGFGIIVILVGMIWLAAKMGWFAPDLFWPVALLVAGIAILTLNIIRGGKSRNNGRPKKEV